MADATSLSTSFILSALRSHQSRYPSTIAVPPLFVAVQGPQGSGKTYLTERIRTSLTDSESLNIAVLSIDDLYLTHDKLVSLHRSNPGNLLWTGRGQPGTHDVNLGQHVLGQLSNINNRESGIEEVELPRFDKSLFDGEGDRSPPGSGVVIRYPPKLDIVILEGWCVGFQSWPEDRLESLLNNFEIERKELVEKGDIFNSDIVNSDDVRVVNAALKQYTELWQHFDVLIQLRPPHIYHQIYRWRLEAEHTMKAQNGGRGMTDEQIRKFVDRYVPGYIFFLDSITRSQGEDVQAPSIWSGKGLRIMIGEHREILGSERF